MKVFVSSTYIDLKEHRKAVEKVINLFEWQFIGMEHFTAEPKEPKEAALDKIDQCDLFIGIYAYRYGSKPEGSEKSITEIEYNYANGKMPCFCFRVEQLFDWPNELKESGVEKELEIFFNSIKQLRDDTFTTPDNLAMNVSTALIKWILGKNISKDEYLKIISLQFLYIPTIDSDTSITMDRNFIDLQLNPFDQDEQVLYGNEFNNSRQESFRSLNIKEVLNHKRVVILGNPGLGKTTLLQYLAYKFAIKDMPKKLIPFFISLKHWANKKLDILDYLIDSWCPIETNELKNMKKQALVNWFKEGDCILLFDGLDEIDNSKDRSIIIDKIENLSSKYPQNYILISSRIVGYDNAFRGSFRQYIIMPINEQRIYQYIVKYYANDLVNYELLYKKLKKDFSLLSLAKNPFLLMIISFLTKKKNLVNFAQRIDIYENSKNEFFKHRNIEHLDNVLEILEEVSYQFKCRSVGFDNKFNYEQLKKINSELNLGYSNFEIGNILNEIKNDSGLLIELQNNYYTFFHPSYHDYFAACALTKKEDWLKIIESKVWDNDWEEVIRFFVAIISKPDNQFPQKTHQFFAKLMETEDDMSNNILSITAKCASDCINLSDDIKQKISKNIYDKWFQSINYNDWIDESAFYTFASTDTEIFNKLLDNLVCSDNDIREASIIALGNIGNHVAVEKLVGLLETENYFLKEKAIVALGRIGSHNALNALVNLLKQNNYKGSISEKIIFALRDIGGEEVTKILLSALSESLDPILSHDILGVLLQSEFNNIVEVICKAVLDNKGQIKNWLKSNINAIEHPKIEYIEGGMGMIFTCSRESEKLGEYQKIISKGNSAQKVNILKSIADLIGYSSAEFIGKFANSLNEFRKETERQNEEIIKKHVQEEIRDVGIEKYMKSLNNALLTSSDENLKINTIIFLGEIYNDISINRLFQALSDESSKIKIIALQCLSKSDEGMTKLSSEEGILLIKDSFITEDEKKSLIKILSGIHNNDSAKILINTLLKDANDSIRKDVIEALGNIGDSSAELILINLLDDVDKQIRENTAKTLGKIGRRDAIKALNKRLEIEENKWVRHYIWEGLRHVSLKNRVRIYADGNQEDRPPSESPIPFQNNPEIILLRISFSDFNVNRFKEAITLLREYYGSTCQDIIIFKS